VPNLIQLQAEAPIDVENLVTADEEAIVTDEEKEDLKALIALATRRLNGGHWKAINDA